LQLINGQLPALVKAGYYWVDARDVADAAIAAERCGRCGSRYILAGSYATFREIAGWISEFTGARLPRFAAPIWLARLAAPFVAASSRRQNRRPLFTPQSIEIVTRHQSIQSDKAHRELGFNPRPLRETIRDTVLWLQTHRC
jgi:dihydroflavonol-4-reductase